jgi:hypothetical protein
MLRQIVRGLKSRTRVRNTEMAYEFTDFNGRPFCSSVRLIEPGHGLFRAPP